MAERIAVHRISLCAKTANSVSTEVTSVTENMIVSMAATNLNAVSWL
jgi:hypothetical protein